MEISNLTLSDVYIFDINKDLKLIDNIRKGIDKGLKEYKVLNPKFIREPLISYSFNLERIEPNNILLEIENIIKSKNRVDIIEFHFSNCYEVSMTNLLIN